MIKSIVLFILFSNLVIVDAYGQVLGIPLKTSQLSVISSSSLTSSTIGESIIYRSHGEEIILHQGFVQRFELFKDSRKEISNSVLGIYPVPSFQFINIEGNQEFRYSHFVILDNLGKSYQKGQLEKENVQTIDIQSLDSGIYFIKFISTKNNQTKTLKFLKL